MPNLMKPLGNKLQDFLQVTCLVILSNVSYLYLGEQKYCLDHFL